MMDKKISHRSGGALGVVIVFLYFASLVFIHVHAFGNFDLPGEIIIGIGAGLFAVVFVYALGSALDRAKEMAARVFRAAAIGLLVTGFVVFPVVSLGGGISCFAMAMMASAVFGGSFAVVSFAWWKNWGTACVIGVAVLFSVPFVTGKIPLFYH